LRVPYYLVPRALSNVTTDLSLKHHDTAGVAVLRNPTGAIAGTGDFYAWGLESKKQKLGRIDLRAAGIQSLDAGQDKVLVFAVNTFNRWSTPEQQEFDVAVDIDGDGSADFIVFNVDFGLVTIGAYTGEEIAAVFDLHTGILSAKFDAVAPTNGSTILLPVFASSLGVTATNPRFAYSAESFDLLSSDTDAFTTSAAFNAFDSAISTGNFVTVAPDAVETTPVSINPTEAAVTPAKGLMIVVLDNKNGQGQADLIKVKDIDDR